MFVEVGNLQKQGVLRGCLIIPVAGNAQQLASFVVLVNLDEFDAFGDVSALIFLEGKKVVIVIGLRWRVVIDVSRKKYR